MLLLTVAVLVSSFLLPYTYLPISTTQSHSTTTTNEACWHCLWGHIGPGMFLLWLSIYLFLYAVSLQRYVASCLSVAVNHDNGL